MNETTTGERLSECVKKAKFTEDFPSIASTDFSVVFSFEFFE